MFLHPLLKRECILLIESQRNGKTRNGKYYQTHCQNGHAFDEINTYISPKSRKRTCRVCQSERNKRQWRIAIITNRAAAKVHMRKWRADNPERDRRNWTELRKHKRRWLDSYKASHPCIKCGEAHIACLDFHHRNRADKRLTLAFASNHASLERIQMEVAKCDILCSNCHRKLHWQERNCS